MLEKKFFQKTEYLTAITTFIFGLIVHLFCLTNGLNNYDSINVQPQGYGTGIESGRWFLDMAGNMFGTLFGNYNIPLLNGIIFIALIAISAGFLVSVFKIRNKKFAALSGMLFVAFPAVCSVMFFMYTTIYYGIAVLLSVLAAWVLPKYRKWGLILSAVCTALSLGIYQAYLPLTAAVFVLALIQKALNEDIPFSKIFKEGLYACLSLILGLILYYVVLKILLVRQDIRLNSYQAIDSMGIIPPARIPGLIRESFLSFVSLAREDYCDLSTGKTLQWCYLLLGAADICMVAVCLLKKKKKFIISLLVIGLCLLFPIAANLIVIMCPDAYIYTIMVYGVSIMLWTPVVLWESLPCGAEKKSGIKAFLSRVITILLALMLFAYAYLANVNYTLLYYSNRQMGNYMSSIIIQARSAEGFDAEKKWALIGEINDPLLDAPWDYISYFGGNAPMRKLLSSYSRNEWISNYLGYELEYAQKDELKKIQESSAYQNMPCWPTEGSIKVIDDYVVIKFE